jgi:hypothetical protein
MVAAEMEQNKFKTFWEVKVTTPLGKGEENIKSIFERNDPSLVCTYE